MSKVVFIVAALTLFILGFGLCFTTTPYKFPEAKFFPKMPVAENNPVTQEGVNLGRHLFYDPILSLDSSMSCASCHKQQFAFSDSFKDLSSGRNGELMKRNTMPLFNLAWHPAFFWDGRAASIEEQVFHPIRAANEMNLKWNVASDRLERNHKYKQMFFQAFGIQKIDSIQISNAIAQFLRTFISVQSKYDQVIQGKTYFTKDELDGFILLNTQTKGDCLHCHTTDGNALGTTFAFSNNGLDSISDPQDYKDKGRGGINGKVSDYGKFIVPSLRNLAFTAPYMHDGRFKTLEEVIDFYSNGVQQSANIDSKMEFVHQGGVKLSEIDKKKIVSFLLTMSDSLFVSNPEFSSPY